MRYKTMKKSGVDISAITVGTWAIGGANSLGASYGEVDDAESIRAIRAMLEGGVNLIDTAPIYGSGHSEEVVGKAMQGLDRDKIVLATKFGSYIEDGKGVHKSTPESIEREFADSVRRLGTEYYSLDAELHRLVGQDSGRTWRLGQRVAVVLTLADARRHVLEFRLAGEVR